MAIEQAYFRKRFLKPYDAVDKSLAVERLSSNPSNDLVTLTAITEAALREFKDKGEVVSVHCDVCGSLIELHWLGSNQSAVSIKCSCGKFHGALRGILK